MSDETNLIAVSKSMAFDKTVYNTTMGNWYYDMYWPINQEIPKRPLLFPFCVHLFHLIFGYSFNNAFIFNGLILFLTLSTVYILGKNFYNEWIGFSLMLLLSSQPIITLSATSAGYDFFSTFFFLLVNISLYNFIKNSNADNFAFLWINLLMLANIRYESIIYILILTLLLHLFRKLQLAHWVAHPILYSCSPLLLLPLIWQFILKQGSHENPLGVPLFGFDHFIEHFKELGVGLVNFSFFLPYATIPNLIALFILGIIIGKIILGKINLKEDGTPYFTIIMVIMVATNMIIVLSHYFGHYTHPTAARGFLVFTTALTLTPLLLKYISPVLSFKWILTFSLFSFILYHPVAIEGRFTSSILLVRESRIINSFLKAQNKKRILLITDRPGQYSVLNFGSVNFVYANKNSKKLLIGLQNHLFEEIYVVQKFLYHRDQIVKPGYELNPDFRLETIQEIQNQSEFFLRISRVR